MVSSKSNSSPSAKWALLAIFAILAVLLYVFFPARPAEAPVQNPPVEEGEPLVPPKAEVHIDESSSPVQDRKGVNPAEEFFLSQTTERRRGEIWREALGGSNNEKLGLALQILEAPTSAWTEPARDLLLLYVGEDVGDDPSSWRRAVEQKQRKLAQDREKILQNLEEHRAKFPTP